MHACMPVSVVDNMCIWYWVIGRYQVAGRYQATQPIQSNTVSCNACKQCIQAQTNNQEREQALRTRRHDCYCYPCSDHRPMGTQMHNML